MRYRPLGKTGLQVSIVSYGASPLGSVFRDVDEAEGARCVRRALELGINYLDCAPYYGSTRAETALGRALQNVPRGDYLLATKVGRYDEGEFDFSAERVTQSVDESLSRLQTDYVDVIQCHDIEFVELSQIVHETLPALRRVVEQGKARFVGITGLPLRALREVLSQTNVDTILSYCRYTLFDTSLESLLPALHGRGVGAINASPLSMGLLTERGAPDWHPAPPDVRDACGHAVALCRERGQDIAKLALQFACANEQIATTLVGTASPANIEKNACWIEEPLDQELLRDVQNALAPIRDRTWPSGLPENND